MPSSWLGSEVWVAAKRMVRTVELLQDPGEPAGESASVGAGNSCRGPEGWIHPLHAWEQDRRNSSCGCGEQVYFDCLGKPIEASSPQARGVCATDALPGAIPALSGNARILEISSSYGNLLGVIFFLCVSGQWVNRPRPAGRLRTAPTPPPLASPECAVGDDAPGR